jgi:hypothetical protein
MTGLGCGGLCGLLSQDYGYPLFVWINQSTIVVSVQNVYCSILRKHLSWRKISDSRAWDVPLDDQPTPKGLCQFDVFWYKKDSKCQKRNLLLHGTLKILPSLPSNENKLALAVIGGSIFHSEFFRNKRERKKKEEEQGALILSSKICFAASTLSTDIRFHDI